jgi:excinuclease ABC subunit C
MSDSSSRHSDELLQKVAGLPTRPGVYLHRDTGGTIIYVGKAKNLRARVKSYFQEGRPVDAKTRALMLRIADFETIVTDTEVEALILENTLIKEHKPKYNILLKDDKSYPYIRVTREEFPRVFPTRRVIRDGSTYYGPYTDGTYLYGLMKTLRSVFPLRSCDLPLTDASIATGKYRVCLDYHIRKCEGPCEAHVGREDYGQHIRDVHRVLQGKTRDLERELETRMHELAELLRFEDAADVRRRLLLLREYTGKQKVVSTDEVDRDVLALARGDTQACVVLLLIRDGKLIGKRHVFVASARDSSDAEIVRQALERWYIDAEQLPEEVLLPCDIDDADVMEAYLAQVKGRAVHLHVPKIGDKKKVLQMAEMNADVLLRERLLQQAQLDQSLPKAVLSLQADLRMERMPRRIECFDNSHMQGTDYVSSMVVFADGKPKKSEYRHYKLRTVEGNDDFEAMKEVLTRRFSRALDEEQALPDLLIIDGGKGQLSHAMEVLESLNLVGRFTVIGLAKRLEEVFTPNSSTPLYLAKTSPSLRLLQQARDEAHRFAITYHRTLRSKRTLQTALTGIAGVGDARAKKLLSALGSVEQVRLATHEQLAAIVGEAVASAIRRHFDSPGAENV